MNLQALQAAIEAALGEAVEIRGHVGGVTAPGAATLRTRSKRQLFLKWSLTAAADQHPVEAAGLERLGATGAVRVPRVEAVGPHFLVLELVRSGKGGPDFGPRLGRALAALHRTTAPSWGFEHTTYCGPTPQDNTQGADWPAFFAERRLGALQARLRATCGLPPALDAALDRLRPRLPDLIATGDPPSLVHGDLWGGNVLVSADDEPVLIDPAVHFGHREVDLALSELFGGFPASFYAAYHEAWPLAPGYADRRAIYNLYHLLNHALLFGGGYAAQALAVAQRYAGA